MLRTVKTKNFNIIHENFKSIFEMVTTVDSRTANFDKNYDFDKDWAGANSFKEAKEVFLQGYEEPLKEVISKVEKIDRKKTIETNTKTKMVDDVAGFMPIVPNALNGLPNSMINVKMYPKKTKILNVLVDTTYNAGVNMKEAMEYFGDLFAYLISLEKQGFRTRISVMNSFSYEDVKTAHVWTCLLKNEFQPIDIKKMMFPFMHTAMFRVIGFSWYQRVPNGTYMSGYGRATSHWRKERVEELISGVMDEMDKYYYVQYKSDFKKIFKDVK